MANSLTYYGQIVLIKSDIRSITGFVAGTAGNVGGFSKVAARLKLYTSASTPSKSVGLAAFTEASGGGYAAKTIAEGDWTASLSSGNYQIQLADQTWTATGGSIANVAGAYITDASGNVMAWFERGSTVTINDGEDITADDLIVRPG